MSNGQAGPIQYPTITVPGKGIYTVKFGLGASYKIEQSTKQTIPEIMAQLQTFFPRTEGNVTIPGRVGIVLLMDLLSAMIWDQAKLTAEDLAFCWDDPADLPEVATAVMGALAKTRWSHQVPLREVTTHMEPVAPLQ